MFSPSVSSVTPFLFFGGPYSNLQALEALLAEAARRRIPPSQIVSTGDLVAYCADAKDVVDRVRQTGIRFIRGNCEEQLAAGAADCGCGFAPGGACDRLSAHWFGHALRQLDEDDRRFLGAAPARLELVVAGLRIAVVHGAAGQTNRFVFASTPERIKTHDLDLLRADVVVAGHSGLPFTQSLGARLWHNPGALGMPANDGAPQVWFSVVSPGKETGSLEIEHAALDYDFEAAARAMEKAGLAPDYALTLRNGIWPNCDALPPAETRAQGHRLDRVQLTWRAGDETRWPLQAEEPARAGPAASPAFTPFERLDTLWINTGTLCNLACATCYIESSPRNDALSFMRADEVSGLLDEIARENLSTRLIGFTGGEPFLNRDLPVMLADALERGFETLVLTNAMKPMRRAARDLIALKQRHGARLALRVSLDHYTRELHEIERGPRSFEPAMQGLAWLAREGFPVSVAGRLYSGESESVARGGYARLFADRGLPLDALSPDCLVLFPEMEAAATGPGLDESCWAATGRSRSDMMCATSRMALRRKGADRLSIVACTLLPHASSFDFGPTLQGAARDVALGHAHCAAFCLFGGANCSK